MSDISYEILAIWVAWMVLIVVVCGRTIRSGVGSTGLPAAFLFSMTFQYLGSISYAVPGYSHLRAGGDPYLVSYGFTETTVLLGMYASVLGVLGFTIGCLISRGRTQKVEIQRSSRAVPVNLYNSKFLLKATAVSALLGFGLNVLNIQIPMAFAFSQVCLNAMVVFICLGAAIEAHNQRMYLRWLILGSLVPVAYLMILGFLSFGFISFTICAGFWMAVLNKRRFSSLRLGIGSLCILYLFLSLFIAWMSFRDEIRRVIWSAADLSSRAQVIYSALGDVELLQPYNFRSLDFLNGRLNQYVFVGKAIEWHNIYPQMFLYGKTLLLVFLSWVPRILWPGKPAMGGSTFVAEHTGLRFAESVTFGTGPVLEFYVNFGYIGVLIGFVALGLTVRWIDARASSALRSGNLFEFSRWFAVGLAFIAPLSQMFFIASTAAASWAVFSALRFVSTGQNRGDQKQVIGEERGIVGTPRRVDISLPQRRGF